jgi:hypothetical protein
MTAHLDDTRRALRLLRWYSRAWRDRYGEEFVDHLEREFGEKSVDHKRAINVAYKGLATRLADVGLSNADDRIERRQRAAAGTTFVLTGVAAVFALSFWSRAMMPWNGPGEPRATVPDTLATGASPSSPVSCW